LIYIFFIGEALYTLNFERNLKNLFHLGQFYINNYKNWSISFSLLFFFSNIKKLKLSIFCANYYAKNCTNLFFVIFNKNKMG